MRPVSHLIKHIPHRPDRLLDQLWAIQKDRGFVSALDQSELARLLNISVASIREVISFYHFFFDRPMGEITIFLDKSIMAQHFGAQKIKKAFETELKIKCGEVSKDGSFGLFETSCIGMSDQEPAALINMIPFVNLTPELVKKIVRLLKSGYEAKEVQQKLKLAPKNIIHQNIYLTHDFDQELSTLHANQLNADQIIEEVMASGLRGRGGAGFPTGKKWQLCKKFPGEHVVVCNADEGEPGTFKDRFLLTHHPEQAFIGMAIAAKAIEAKEAILYLRAEYAYLLESLHMTLTKLQRNSLVRDIKFRIQLGAGAYVVGEESALLESLEGKRGEPRLRPPFPVEKGYLGQPTIVNNVETFVAVASILTTGHERFISFGSEKSRGTRLLSVSGDVKRPGIYEIAWGQTVEEFLTMVGAVQSLAVQVGGPSGELVRVDIEKHRKLCFEDLPTGGSMMVYNKKRSLIDIAHNYIDFFVDESCGNCTPCRAGNVILKQQFEKMMKGHSQKQDLGKLIHWSEVIMKSSRCGLGMTSPRIFVQLKNKFPELFDEILNEDSLHYAFDEKAMTSDYDQIMKELS
ncbi:MAG: NADH-quinone oxidoreductase subunit NuoF [Bacteriovoracaceae bacterium]